MSEVADPPVIEEEQQELDKKLQIQVVDVTQAAQDNAVDRAEEFIDEQTRTEVTAETFGGRLRQRASGIVKRIWYGNIARDYVRQREIDKNRQRNVDERNIYAAHGYGQEDHDRALGATLTRFTSELGLHEGESNRDLAEIDQGETIAVRLRSLVSSFASTDMSVEALREAKTRIIDELGQVMNEQDRKKGLLLADNVIEVAQHARAAFEHGLGLDRIDQAMGVKAGEARLGVRTEVHKDVADRLIEKVHEHGAMLNETTLAAGVGIALSLGKFTTRKAATAAGATIGLGVGAGIIGGLRERLRMKQERQLHSRQLAENGEQHIGGGNPRRAQLELARYEAVPAVSLLGSLQGSLANLEMGADSAGLAEAIANLAHAQTRIRLSDQMSADFITFSGKTQIEDERLALDLSVAELKVRLQQAVDQADDSLLAAAGISRDVNESLEAMSNWTGDILTADITDKDRVFTKLQRNRALKMGAISFATAVGVGALIQQGNAALSDQMQGAWEDGGDGETRRSVIAGLLGKESSALGDITGEHLAPQAISDQTSIVLPEGFSLEPNNSGYFNLLDADGKTVSDHIGFDDAGNLDGPSQVILGTKGITHSSVVESYEVSHTETFQSPRTPEEYMSIHPEEFTAVERQLWYDNNTPGSFDRNELRLHWGGQNGLDANGNYVFNVSHMMPEGSFHGDEAVNFMNEIQQGNLKIALSATDGTQNFVKLVDIDMNGNAVIDANSFIGQSLFENVNGEARFDGFYAEVVQLTGTNAEGETTMRMLATHIGEKSPQTGMDTFTNVVVDQQERVITTLDVPAGEELPTEIAPVLPIYGRRGLESFEQQLNPNNPNIVANYYGGRSLEELREWIESNPGILHTRKRVEASDGSVSWIETDGSEVVRDIARERQILSSYLEKQRDSNPNHMELVDKLAESMKPMRPETRVAVNVPAWMEEANLPNLLKQYSEQVALSGEPLSHDLYEVNILVNRKTGSQGDRSVEVIEKFITDFESEHGFKPSINYYDIEIDPPYNNVGYARKLLTDAVVARSLARETQEGPLYFETEDADLVNIDKRTIINIIDKMDKHPEYDAVRGVQDRAPEYLKENDYLFVRRRAMDFFEILARNKRFRDPTNPSWNFTWNRIVTGGWNTAYSAEAYALIDGYDPVVSGEDMSIGEKITMIRGDGKLPNLEVVGKVYTRTDSSPRRYIQEVVTEEPAYNDFANEAVNELIRNRSVEESLEAISNYARINDDNKQSFGIFLSNMYNWFQSATPSDEEASQLTKRMLFFLGFKKNDYEFENGGLKIKSFNNLKQSLDKYRQRYA